MNAVAPLHTPDTKPDRRHFLGGSDAGAILGLSIWRSPYEVWLEKTGDQIPEDPRKQKIFNRGKRLEPYVLDMLRDEHGIRATGVNQRFVDPEFNFLACEVDAITDDDEDVEIKTVHPFRAKEWGEQETDEIPPVYTAQAQHGLMIRPKRSRLVAALIGADDLRIYRVERDDQIISKLREHELSFWNLVQARTPPPPIRLSDLDRLYGVDLGQVIAIDDNIEILDALERVRKYKADIKTANARLEDEELIVKGFMKHASVLTVGGKKTCSWKTQSADCIDITALRERRPEIAAQFTKARPSRVFRT
jgi:putative phage-type endonuclease